MSGWMWRAPKLMTGSGAAASTHARAAVAQPVDWASMPEEGRLVQPEPAVAGADPEHDLLRPDDVAVVQRLEPRLGRVGLGEHVAEQVARLVDPAQDGVLAGEDLHRHERIAAFLLEDRLGAREIDIGRVARQDLVRRPRARQAHQSGSAPLPPGCPASVPSTGSGEAASVAYESAPEAAAWPRSTGASVVAADDQDRAGRSPADARRRRRRDGAKGAIQNDVEQWRSQEGAHDIDLGGEPRSRLR